MKALNKFFLLLLIVVMLKAAVGCSRPVVREEFTESYQVRPGTLLSIDNPYGNVVISGWEESRIEVNVVKESDRGPEALEQAAVNIDLGDNLLIRTLQPEGSKMVRVDYTLKVPVDMLVSSISCLNGDVTVEGATGNPVINTANGAINVSNLNGMVTARSSNGNIMISGVRSLGDLESSNGNVSAELRAIHDDLRIKTSNGSITLLILPSLELSIEALTSNGKISAGNLRLDLSSDGQAQLSGVLNGGGYKVRLETSNGSIELAPLK